MTIIKMLECWLPHYSDRDFFVILTIFKKFRIKPTSFDCFYLRQGFIVFFP